MMKIVRRLLLVLFLLALAVFFGVPLLVGTDWAREQVRSALADATGRKVELGAISFGWFSGLSVEEVRVAQLPGQYDEEGDLFTLGALHLDVSIRDVLRERIRVDRISVEDPEFVIVRERDGTLNIADLLRPEKEEPPDEDVVPVTAKISLAGGRIVFVDRKLGTRIEARDIEGEATWREGRLDLDLGFFLNGGESKVTARADFTRAPSPFVVEKLSVRGASLSADMAQLGILLPLMGDHPREASGSLDLTLDRLAAEGFDRQTLSESLEGSGRLGLSAGALVSVPVGNLVGVVRQSREFFDAVRAGDIRTILGSDLAALVTGNTEERLEVDLLTSEFSIAKGVVKTEMMEIRGAGLEIGLSGEASLGGAFEYRITERSLTETWRKLVADRPRLAKVLREAPSFSYQKDPGGEPAWGIPWFSGRAAVEALRGLFGGSLPDRIPERLRELLPGGR